MLLVACDLLRCRDVESRDVLLGFVFITYRISVAPLTNTSEGGRLSAPFLNYLFFLVKIAVLREDKPTYIYKLKQAYQKKITPPKLRVQLTWTSWG
jgi:hypothetical protein